MEPVETFGSSWDNAAGMLWRAARRDPAKAAIRDAGGERARSFAELWDDALAVSDRLRAAGVCPGDRVAIFVERGAASAAAYFGVLASGGAAVIVEETLRPRQIRYILNHAGVRAIVASRALRGRLPEDAQQPGGESAHAESPSADVIGVEEACAEGPRERAPAAPRAGGDIAHIIYTSGSTGMPKGVVVSHENVWAGMQAVSTYLGITERDRIASLLPFSFDYGLSQLHCAIGAGATLVVERTPLAPRIVETLAACGVTVLAAVPPLWLQLLDVERFRARPLEALRVMTNTGGRLPVEAVRTLRRCQPGADLVLMYGLTEAFRSTYLPPHLVDRKPSSIGRAIPGAEILVLREDYTPCGPGEIGQLVHRGPTVTLGYWDDPEATRERFGPNPVRPRGAPDAERVVFSGDLVKMDEDGDLEFVGREDAMIKSMGYRVGPDEITDVLYSSREIVEAVITTEPDPMRGDAIVAHVVLVEGGDLDRLKRYAMRELPRYMQPRRYEVHDALARTASGKHDSKAMTEAEG